MLEFGCSLDIHVYVVIVWISHRLSTFHLLVQYLSRNNFWSRTKMDFESQIHQLKLEYAAETIQQLGEVDSEIQKLSQEMEGLRKSHGDALTQIYVLNAELARLKNNLTDERMREQDIETSNEVLSSRLVVVHALLEPFENEYQTHKAKLDVAGFLKKKRLSQKVPSTNFTKRLEAQTDETISLEQEEIRKVTEASKCLTDEVIDLKSKLESGTLNWENQMEKIINIKCEIRICKQKLTQVESNKQYYLSQLKCVTDCLEIVKQGKEHLLGRQEVLGNFLAGSPYDDSEKTSIKSSSQPENPLNMTPLV